MCTLVLITLLAACNGDKAEVTDTSSTTSTATTSTTGTTTTTATTTTTTATTSPCDAVTCANGTCDDSSGDAVCICDGDFHGDVCDLRTVWAPNVGETEAGTNLQNLGVYTRSHVWANQPEALPVVPMEVTAVRFRRSDQLDPAIDLLIPNVTVVIGTGTPGFPASGVTFDGYFIGDQREVFWGQVNLPAIGANPLAFDAWEITISPPFPYDPANGRLALDFQMPGAPLADTIPLDCNNDASNYMLMTNEAFIGAVPPAFSNNATGCAPMMELDVRY